MMLGCVTLVPLCKRRQRCCRVLTFDHFTASVAGRMNSWSVCYVCGRVQSVLFPGRNDEGIARVPDALPVLVGETEGDRGAGAGPKGKFKAAAAAHNPNRLLSAVCKIAPQFKVNLLDCRTALTRRCFFREGLPAHSLWLQSEGLAMFA